MLDAHCHIDLYEDPYQIALDAERHRVYTLAVTRLPSHFLQAQTRLRNLHYVRPALGFHPMLVAENFDEINQFKNLVHLTRYIGEVGLDFSARCDGEREQQREAFEHILSLIRGQDKILSIHSRRAEAEVLELVLQYECRKSIFHWYSGPLSTLREIIAQGFYLSVNTQMLRTRSGRKIIESTPIDRVLTETDGPFVKTEGRVAQPTDVALIEAGLAEIWTMEREEVSQVIMSNLKGLLSVEAPVVAAASLGRSAFPL
jgi:TatD DNase family protein